MNIFLTAYPGQLSEKVLLFLTVRTADSTSSDEIRRQIRRLKNPVFTTRDILNSTPDVSRTLVDQVLSRMVRSGEIERISRGFFSRRRHHKELGPIPPSSEDITAAVERAVGMPVVPSGALALNALNLSQQVPARLEFKTAGPSRKIQIGKRQIWLEHAPARRFRARNRMVALVIEALEALGRENVASSTVDIIRSAIEPADRTAIRMQIGDAPGWMQPHLRAISAA